MTLPTPTLPLAERPREERERGKRFKADNGDVLLRLAERAGQGDGEERRTR